MSDPSQPSKREARAERIRAYREKNAGATGRYQRQRSTFLAWLLGGVGLLIAVGSAVNQLWWGAAGGLLVVCGALSVWAGERRRVETVDPSDQPAHRYEMGYFLLGVVLVVAGLVVTVHPW